MARVTCVIILLVAIVTFVQSIDFPWLNDNDVKVINRTDTSVVLTWQLPKDISLIRMKKYLLFVKYKRLGYSARTIEAHHADPDCSLLLSHCHLRNLVPGQAYSATITIHDPVNGTTLGRAEDLPFATLNMPDEEKDLVWWLVYAAAPAVLLILLVLAIVCIARCCRCCCWRKKKKSIKMMSKPSTEGEPKKDKSGTTSPDSSSLDRKHSLQTRQWVKDTLATIDLDPESSTYDHAEASVVTYDIPGDYTRSTFPMHTAGNSKRNHSYLEVVEDPPRPQSASGSQSRSKPASTEPATKIKGKKLKKNGSNPSLPKASVDLSSPANGQDVNTSPPKPCKMKPPKDRLQKTANLPYCKRESKAQSSPTQGTPPASPLFELQQKLEGKLQLQQQQQQQQQQLFDGQATLETHHYANTNDLNQLKGNARKMFPML
ncbi:hypothetical protein ElyMa_005119300 [Elysia marginata]|uniref:Fibronectin type-III domain-containing protein n=1 Tax=Elysia marginata TaxID=1093978 RepID=A0AAV4JL61_9GAST|nr:hypothetical protein ElyMa_005119300 [Elysia marginata]